MRTVRGLSALERAVAALRKKGRVGFVPTLGALHEGHLSLVRRAKKENASVVVSIFVNPLQFGPKEDLRRYPRNLRADAALLKKAGVDLLFAPSAEDFYKNDFETQVVLPGLSRGLCGRSRPTHFAGVATVVLKLLNLVRPQALYLGQKDYQQYRVLKQMAKDLAVPVDVKLCPTLREKDGLAMSSRNIFLSKTERQEASGIFRALLEAKKEILEGVGSATSLRKAIVRRLSLLRGGKVDYVEVVDAESLKPVVQLRLHRQVLVAVAVFFSRARLIDNCLVRVGKK